MRDAAIALRRFGLGARPGEVARIAADPRGFVRSQLDRPEAARIAVALPASHHVVEAFQSARAEQRDARIRVAPPSPALPLPSRESTGDGKAGATTSPGVTATAGQTVAAERPRKDEPRPQVILREAFQSELAARIGHAVATDAPFLERLVLFWSNHFAVSIAKGLVRGIAGAYEREAIRPHVLGRFADMLKAVTQHPAMLVYLDNAQSIGPASQVGSRRARGLNENLARELLELHTLGVDGGYTQADVTALARLLTGWTIGQIDLAHTVPGKFFFAAPRHEPGGATVLGKRYAQGGLAEGEAALADLARHASTARHIATRLARHFVSEGPPPALVARLEQTFLATNGDLRALAEALATHGEAWSPPPAKVVPPYDFLVSIARGVAPVSPPLAVHRFAAALGQPTWSPPSPKGWPDDDEAWTGPAAIRERLRIAELFARRAGPIDPRDRAADILGGLATAATREAIDRAETREQGIELLVMAPEFLRR